MNIDIKELNKLMELNPSWEIWTRFENTQTIVLRISDAETEEFICSIVIYDTYCTLEDENENVFFTTPDFSEIVNYLTMSNTKLKEELLEAVNEDRYIDAIALITILKNNW